MTEEHRLPTRQLIQSDLPRFDVSGLASQTRDALVELLLTMADDEFVLGFCDSEWTGIAPMLEEDVAFSSLSQDEIGHARIWYEMLAQLTDDTADHIAYGRQPHGYHHSDLVDHPRTDWAFTIARRWLYETADAVRLAALADATWRPLADVVAKIRREERYHVMHLDLWLRRLAEGGDEGRSRLESALERLVPDGPSVFASMEGEDTLLSAGILSEPMSALADSWSDQANRKLSGLGFSFGDLPQKSGGRDRSVPSAAFKWLWGEFTSVYRSEEGATW
jgi:ring-1,2-phenylacetyl-CoA epoxidase subunit PaaC